MSKRFIPVVSAVMIFGLLAAGCMTRSITANGVTAKESQFLMWSYMQGFDIETNGAVRIGSYLTMADTNGMDKVEQMIEKAIAAAVKAGLVAGMMMKEPESEQIPYGRPFRVQRFNGAEGPFDVQIVPVAQDDKAKARP